ncbi:MAG: DUF4065 domain-containing protein [Bacteroidales bacterium]|nr:DUF4065 domain-containing protein [Bacteroidales bacterium]
MNVVNERWDKLYSSMEDIEPEIVSFPSGHSGEQLVSKIGPDLSEFSKEELSILEEITYKFGGMNANQLSELSHREEAWQHFVDPATPIDYSETFSLKTL